VDDSLHAGAGRRTINPPLGIGKIGGHLFGEPIQWLESDLTATALVLRGAGGKVALVAVDLWTVETRHADTIRSEGGWRLGERYALPDWIPQIYPGQVTALHPDSERRALEGTLALIRELT
jgi:hypothetical protein